jgi:hypothetical protein
MALNFDQFFETLKTGVVDIAKTEAADFLEQATDDGKKFLEDTKDKLKKWAKMLVGGELDKDEFESLVRGQKDLSQMTALKQAGMAAIRIDRIRVAVIDLVVKAAGALV